MLMLMVMINPTRRQFYRPPELPEATIFHAWPTSMYAGQIGVPTEAIVYRIHRLPNLSLSSFTNEPTFIKVLLCLLWMAWFFN
jgi:hypothetical protein